MACALKERRFIPCTTNTFHLPVPAIPRYAFSVLRSFPANPGCAPACFASGANPGLDSGTALPCQRFPRRRLIRCAPIFEPIRHTHFDPVTRYSRASCTCLSPPCPCIIALPVHHRLARASSPCPCIIALPVHHRLARASSPCPCIIALPVHHRLARASSPCPCIIALPVHHRLARASSPCPCIIALPVHHRLARASSPCPCIIALPVCHQRSKMTPRFLHPVAQLVPMTIWDAGPLTGGRVKPCRISAQRWPKAHGMPLANAGFKRHHGLRSEGAPVHPVHNQHLPSTCPHNYPRNYPLSATTHLSPQLP
ncbi:hypothetical protein APED_16795 [Acanthopleuribacter pedis]